MGHEVVFSEVGGSLHDGGSGAGAVCKIRCEGVSFAVGDSLPSYLHDWRHTIPIKLPGSQASIPVQTSGNIRILEIHAGAGYTSPAVLTIVHSRRFITLLFLALEIATEQSRLQSWKLSAVNDGG